MISYLFMNNKKIDKEYLLNIFTNNFGLEIVDNTKERTSLGNTEMLVDIDKKYITILLFDELINIKSIKKYLLEKLSWTTFKKNSKNHLESTVK